MISSSFRRYAVSMQKRNFSSANQRRVAESLINPLSASESSAAASLPRVALCEEQLNYLQTIAEGWAFPLKRFMNEQELIESMNMNTITDENGERHILSVPITQHITAEQKDQLEGQNRVALTWKDEIMAIIEEPEIFDNRKEEICAKTFGTHSQNHPKIGRIW